VETTGVWYCDEEEAEEEETEEAEEEETETEEEVIELMRTVEMCSRPLVPFLDSARNHPCVLDTGSSRNTVSPRRTCSSLMFLLADGRSKDLGEEGLTTVATVRSAPFRVLYWGEFVDC
jgi:hypothetical protein